MSGTNNTCNGTTGMSPNNKSSFPNIMMFLTMTAIMGATVQGMAPKTLLRLVPQPIIMLLLYTVAGVISKVAAPLDTDVSVRSVVDPIMIQTLFLPVLMCSELFRLNTRAFFIVLSQLLLLVIPGVVLGSVLTAVYTFAIMPSRPLFTFSMSMAFGGMLATTDPIAVIICVNEMAAPKRLAAVVGGESLLNDGTSIIITTLFITIVNGGNVTVDWIIFFIFNQLVFSILFGIGMGILSLVFIRTVRNDSSTLTTFVVTMPFLTFVVANYFFNSSGVLAMIPLCIMLNEYGRGMLMEHVERIEKLFDNLSFIATGWLYALCGFIVGEVIAGNQITAMDWLSLLLLYVWINIVRFIMVMFFYPVLKYTGYGFSFREALLLVFGGLRGAVGLTLALFINTQVANSDPRSGALTEFFMCGVIFLMMINAVLTPVVLRKLELDSKPNEVLMEALQQKMGEECADTLMNVGLKYEVAQMLAFGTTAQEVKMSRRRFEFKAPTEDEDDMDQQSENLVEHRLTKELVNLEVLIGQRKHLVRAQRQMYEQLLKRKLISRAAWYMLDRAADAQLEVNYFYLDQYPFVLDQAFNSKRFKLISSSQPNFFKCSSGRLLAFLKQKGQRPLEEFMTNKGAAATASVNEQTERPRGISSTSNKKQSMDVVDDPEMQEGGDGAQDNKKVNIRTPLLKEEEVKDDDMLDGEGTSSCLPGLGDVSRSLGMPVSPDEWLYTFALASWGFIIAQRDSTKLVDEMFTVAPDLIVFHDERKALKVEIQEGCTLPARFLDALALHSPDVLQRVKSLHALSEAGNRLFGCVATLASHGLIERNELKRLLRFAEKGLKRIRNCEFELEQPTTVGSQAQNLMHNPNYFPFPHSQGSHIVGLRSMGMDEEEGDDAKSFVDIPEDRPLELDVGISAIGEQPSQIPPPSLGGRFAETPKRLFPIAHRPSGEGSSLGQKQALAEPSANKRRLERRRSCGDYDELRHRIHDGSEVTFVASDARLARGEHVRLQSPLAGPQVVANETILTDYLLTSTMHPMDMTRLKDALKLDDAELKRF